MSASPLATSTNLRLEPMETQSVAPVAASQPFVAGLALWREATAQGGQPLQFSAALG